MKREDWEVIEEDEEIVEEEEEPVEEEVVEEDEERVNEPDEVVIAKPEPSLESYMTRTELFLMHVYETKRYFNMSQEAKRRGMKQLASRFLRESRQHLRVAFHMCPYRPHMCPLYDVWTGKCPVGLEDRCRPLAWSKARPKKIRGWFRKKK
ncbi:hypothetical protein [Thermofilum pendens]|uniref:Uncharacterized protein n=1 Tax=Thermofilum pendens (strain DSM 2475 / Hrk 5) TaxID=368408 RepID=A1S1C1_THEPD|nr:hypothetical protein [Thermofilum pendens]ABL79251.1 hypothetical protein Tpen_1856 [Thermofilum pendens Hrk 5]